MFCLCNLPFIEIIFVEKNYDIFFVARLFEYD